MKKILFVAIAVLLLGALVSPVYAVDENACKTGGLISLNLTPFAVVCGAAVDAINPCALSILILLMASILINGERKKALLVGFSFIAAIYLSYFFLGLGALKLIRTYTLTYSRLFYDIVGVIALIFGALNIKDYFWYGGGGFIMEVPRSWRPKMKSMITGAATPWGAFTIGFVISLFLLPCLSGPYIVILGMLAAKTTFWRAFLYMILYNLIFVGPMIIVVLAMYFGLPAERAEEWRKNKIRLLHLIAGIILILLGIVMLTGWL